MASSHERIHLETRPAGRAPLFNGNLTAKIPRQPSSIAYQPMSVVPSVILSQNSTPLSTQRISGQVSFHPQQAVENVEATKRIFTERQINKAKSLSGLVRSTSLTRPMPIHSTNGTMHGSLHESDTIHPNDDSSSTKQLSETPDGIRRPRVSFSDFDKIQYFDDHGTRHRYRHRSARRTTAAPSDNTYTSMIVIPHSEVSQASHRSLPCPRLVGLEPDHGNPSSGTSPSLYASHPAHPRDVPRQSLLKGAPRPEKYTLRRERPFLVIPEPVNEVPVYSPVEVSRETIRADGVCPSMRRNDPDQSSKVERGDRGLRTSLSNSSLSSLSSHRQRPPLRALSLRQQFALPSRLKTSSSPQLPDCPRRSNSINHFPPRVNSSDFDLDDVSSAEFLSAFGHRPMTSLNASKQLKHNYIVHFGSNRSLNDHTSTTATDPSETRHSSHEPTPTRLRSVLKLVRSPYLTTMDETNHGSNGPMTTTTNDRRIRSPHPNSDYVSPEFQSVSNTIIV